MRVATEKRVQTAFRFRPSLIARIKREAGKVNLSVNSYVEKVLEKETELDWPVLPPDFKISDELKAIQCCIAMPSKEEIEADPRLKHILGL